jgi:hypothetical protein
VLIFFAIYYKSFVKEPVRLKYLVVSGITAFVLSSYFLLPFIEQSLSDSFYFQKAHFWWWEEMPLKAIFNGIIFGNEPKMGVNGLLAAMVCLRFFIKKDKIPPSIDYGLIISLSCIFLCYRIIPWDVFPFTLLHFIQFPWRFMLTSVFLLSIAVGFYVSVLLARQPVRKALFFLFIAFVSSYGMTFRMGDLFAPETPVITEIQWISPKRLHTPNTCLPKFCL